jgi:Uma2 family endonuclease
LGLIPAKTELLYGQVFQKMAKSPPHSLLIIQVLELLRRAIPPHLHVRQEHPITCADSEPEPDLSVVSRSPADYAVEHPHTAELVIEICVTNHEYDCLKLAAYAGADVKEVWLVLVPERQIELHRLPEGGRYGERLLHGPGGRVTSLVLPEFAVDLDTLFAAAAVSPKPHS